jgi:hypothetical protein
MAKIWSTHFFGSLGSLRRCQSVVLQYDLAVHLHLSIDDPF